MSLKFKLIALITLLAIGGFGYFLYTIKDKQAEVITPKPAKTVTATQSSKTKLPEPPKEKWAYRKELSEKEIEVGQYEVENKGPYKMQCGSFRTLKQAEVLKANIAFAGLEAKVQVSNGKNGTYHKVVLGPYERKRLAEKDKHKLKSNNINYCQIWLWR